MLVLRYAAGIACLTLAVFDVLAEAPAQAPVEERSLLAPDEVVEPSVEEPGHPDTWLDRTHTGLHRFLWRSAMAADGWFGSERPEQYYVQRTRGSIIPIVLWDEFNGFNQKFRFRVKMPLPALGERYNAFVGTFTRDEFISEREQASGAIPRQSSGGATAEDQTLIGVQYRNPDRGGRFEADAGLRIRSPIDPFVKGGWRFRRRFAHDTLLLTLRETGFWQNSEGFGLTSRIDLERSFDEDTLIRWSTSGTLSQETQGVRGYSAVTMYHGLRGARAVGAQVFTNVEYDAPVPIGEYGFRAGYRQRVLRDWLVLELRPSLTWPKDTPGESREASWGFGLGLEMFFGNDEFQARPATF